VTRAEKARFARAWLAAAARALAVAPGNDDGDAPFAVAMLLDAASKLFASRAGNDTDDDYNDHENNHDHRNLLSLDPTLIPELSEWGRLCFDACSGGALPSLRTLATLLASSAALSRACPACAPPDDWLAWAYAASERRLRGLLRQEQHHQQQGRALAAVRLAHAAAATMTAGASTPPPASWLCAAGGALAVLAPCMGPREASLALLSTARLLKQQQEQHASASPPATAALQRAAATLTRALADAPPSSVSPLDACMALQGLDLAALEAGEHATNHLLELVLGRLPRMTAARPLASTALAAARVLRRHHTTSDHAARWSRAVCDASLPLLDASATPLRDLAALAEALALLSASAAPPPPAAWYESFLQRVASAAESEASRTSTSSSTQPPALLLTTTLASLLESVARLALRPSAEDAGVALAPSRAWLRAVYGGAVAPLLSLLPLESLSPLAAVQLLWAPAVCGWQPPAAVADAALRSLEQRAAAVAIDGASEAPLLLPPRLVAPLLRSAANARRRPGPATMRALLLSPGATQRLAAGQREQAGGGLSLRDAAAALRALRLLQQQDGAGAMPSGVWLSTLASAFAARLLEAEAGAAAASAAAALARDAASLASALAGLGLRLEEEEEVVGAVRAVQPAQVAPSTSQALADRPLHPPLPTTTAAAAPSSPPHPFTRACLACTGTPARLASLGPARLSRLLLALARMGARPPRGWMAAALSALAADFSGGVPAAASSSSSPSPRARPSDVARAVDALARMSYSPPREWLGGALAAFERRLGSASAADALRMLRALAALPPQATAAPDGDGDAGGGESGSSNSNSSAAFLPPRAARAARLAGGLSAAPPGASPIAAAAVAALMAAAAKEQEERAAQDERQRQRRREQQQEASGRAGGHPSSSSPAPPPPLRLPPPWLKAVLLHLHARRDELTPAGMAELASALARLRARPPPALLDRLAAASGALAARGGGGGGGAAALSPSPLLLLGRRALSDAPNRDVVRLACAAAALRWQPGATLPSDDAAAWGDAAAAAAAANEDAGPPSSRASLQRWVSRVLLPRARPALRALEPPALVRLLAALAALRAQPSASWRAEAVAALKAAQRELSPRDACAAVCACGALFGGRASQSTRNASADAAAATPAPPPSAAFAAALAPVVWRLLAPSGRSISCPVECLPRLLSGCARLGVRVPQARLRAAADALLLLDEAAAASPPLPPEQLVVAAVALARLRLRAPEAWLQELEARLGGLGGDARLQHAGAWAGGRLRRLSAAAATPRAAAVAEAAAVVEASPVSPPLDCSTTDT
jgi:hypothetical protein